MKEKLRNFANSQFMVCVIFLLLGICLLGMPVGTLNVLCKVVFGLALIITGLHHVIRQIRAKDRQRLGDLYAGVITLVIGIFLFSNPQIVVRLLPWILGAFLIIDCIWLIKDAMELRKLEKPLWEGTLALAVLFIIAALFLIFYTFSQVRRMLTFSGIAFFLKAVTDFIFHFLIEKKKKEPVNPHIIPADSADTYSVMPMGGGQPVPYTNTQSEIIDDVPPVQEASQPETEPVVPEEADQPQVSEPESGDIPTPSFEDDFGGSVSPDIPEGSDFDLGPEPTMETP